MIYRQLIEDLEKWSQRPNRKPLVLRGARQVGKTTLIDEFGKLQFICLIGGRRPNLGATRPRVGIANLGFDTPNWQYLKY